MANAVKKLRFETPEAYVKHHLELAAGHWAYSEKKVQGTPQNYQKIDKERAVALCADSFAAHINFTRIVLQELEAVVPLVERANVHFVTIASAQYAVPMSEAAAFDLRGLKSLSTRALKGLNYFGVIEGAYYPKWVRGIAHISFHIHALVFGAAEHELQQRKASFNHRHLSIIPGWQAMHSEPIAAAEAEPKLMYMLKMPCRAYKPFALRTEHVDPDTGAIEKVTTGAFDQKKDAMRPGQFRDMSDAFSERYLDNLIIAGGRGTLMRQRVVDRALAGFERSEYRRNRKSMTRNAPPCSPKR